jgi:very-short-patch-repair endonuclease/predicted nucleic acid-binding Zn ribbon protein
MNENYKKLDECVSVSEAQRVFGFHVNGGGTIKIRKLALECGFDLNVYKLRKKKYCLNCNKQLHRGQYKFCSNRCSAILNNKNRDITDETKNKISKKLKDFFILKYPERGITPTHKECVICNKSFSVIIGKNRRKSRSKTCSSECNIELRKMTGKETMDKIIKEGRHIGWTSRNIVSYPEKFFMEVLNKHNIKYQHNYPILKRHLGVDEPYGYFLDFFIEEKKIDLEIDGKQHFSRKEHDRLRDDILKNNNFNVYRIDWKNINTKKGKKYMELEISKFLHFYNMCG